MGPAAGRGATGVSHRSSANDACSVTWSGSTERTSTAALRRASNAAERSMVGVLSCGSGGGRRWPAKVSASHTEAPVDRYHGARDVGRGVGTQEGDHRGHLLGRAEPADGGGAGERITAGVV